MKKTTGALLLFFVAIAGAYGYWRFSHGTSRPIRVGILHSLSGTMAISEKSVVDSALLAIAEINHDGGVLGRRIEYVISDGKSDGASFAREAEKLIADDGVSTIFGCWTSASRKLVKAVVEKYNHLLIYPVQYEGLEQSRNIIYTGAAPNQQILPAVKWCMDHIGKRFFLVGSDYVFPRTANAIIKDQVESLRGEIMGEEYALLGSRDFADIVNKIVVARPDVILNTINGDSNRAFFTELRNRGINPAETPTMSFSIAEDELRSLPREQMVNDYAAWNYFQSIENAENKSFTAKFKSRYGASRVTDDPMEAAYFGVYLWAQAVTDAGSDNVHAIRKALADQSWNAPEGIVYVDGETNHTWKVVRIGKIRNDGQFDIVWSSKNPIRPVPFPPYRTRAQWEAFLTDLYAGWNNNWTNPG